MMGRRHPRVFLATALAAAGVWISMATSAAATVTPASHCHGVPMPCCPPNDAGPAHCVAAQCIVEMPQKADSPDLPADLAASATTIMVPQVIPGPADTMLCNVACLPDIFRLKDDLRI